MNLTLKIWRQKNSTDQGGFETFKVSDFAGKKLILFFYPKDNTPGCTVENKDFSCLVEDFKKL